MRSSKFGTPSRTGSDQAMAREVLRLLASYVVFGALWIYVSDQFLTRWSPTQSAMAFWSTVKGFGFVAATAGLLWLLIVRVLKRLYAALDAAETSEEKFRQLAENIDDVFWICDKDQTSGLYVSPAYERIWGRSCQTFYARPAGYREAIHAEDRQRVLDGLERLRLGGIYDEEYRINQPNGATRWIHDRGFRVRNAQGEVYRIAGLAEDITVRKELESQLRQAQKMEAVGQLAGGVAHDFNNVVAAVLMHLGLLRLRTDLPPDVQESLNELEKESLRATSLTRQLLVFSRQQVAEFKSINLDAVIHDLLKMLRRLLGEDIELIFEPSSAPSCIRADVGMMEQVVTNLCVNARDAMLEGGTLKLKTSLVAVPANSTRTNPESRPGSFVRLVATDTGCGMDEAVRKRIFEPFFTTKEAGRGTGLGLATVYGIVKQHEGWIEVDSQTGQGASFRIYLPASASPVQSPLPSALTEKMRGGSETVLLVEDEVCLRRATAMCLRKLGYSVFEAADAQEALSLWERHRSNVRLLFTDMILPGGMTGLQLAERLTREDPALRVLIATGYSPQLANSTATPQTFTRLAKPYQPAQIAKLVRECLEQLSFPAE